MVADGSTIYEHNHSLNNLEQFFEKQKIRAVLIIWHLFLSAASSTEHLCGVLGIDFPSFFFNSALATVPGLVV